jgi:hypothetical protein
MVAKGTFVRHSLTNAPFDSTKPPEGAGRLPYVPSIVSVAGQPGG